MPDTISHHVTPRSRRPAVSIEAVTPLAVSRRAAGQLLGYGLTRVYALLKARELESFADGGSRRILMSSITAYIARKLAETTNSKPARRGPGRPRKGGA
jgi:hypothetical protein